LAADKKKNNGPSQARIIRSLIIVVAIAVLFGVISKMGMEMLNSKMGISLSDNGESADSPVVLETGDIAQAAEFVQMDQVESASSVWVPDWKVTPCSVFVSAGSTGFADSLSEAPGPSERATELQLLMELWASHAEFTQTEIESVWAFSSGDTCFIDLPVAVDWTGIARTIEGRFISYTVMFPFVAGEVVNGYESGIPLRGISTNY
jgi:hypothetical protein